MNQSLNPSLIFETFNAYQKTAALQAGIELDIFSAIGGEKVEAAELARRCKASPRGIRILADYLCIIGFLEKDGSAYRLTPDSQAFLVRSSPAYLGGAAEFLGNETLAGAFRNLAEVVRRGRTLLPEQGSVSDENPIWITFARAMGPMMRIPAQAISEMLPYPVDSEIAALDIAAGHGEFGFALARRFPNSTISMLDWEPVLKYTRQKAAEYRLEKQIRYLPGDAFKVPLPSDLSVVLLPNFLHHFSRADCVTMLRRIVPQLRKGGQIIISEFIPNEDRISPPGHAAFALIMLGSTAEGDAYTFQEYREMLQEAGIEDITLEQPGGGMRFVRATK